MLRQEKGHKELATKNKHWEREMKYGNKLAFAEAVALFPILIFALFPFSRFRNILFEFPFFFFKFTLCKYVLARGHNQERCSGVNRSTKVKYKRVLDKSTTHK